MRRKQLLVFLATVLAFSAIIFPAQATQPDPETGEHKVYICHATGSETNPYVLIHVDVKAAENGHSQDSHPEDRSADGPDFVCPDGDIGG